MTPQPTQLLTQEELDDIEANNQLLRNFSAYVEHLERSNPGVTLPTTYMYDAYMVGMQTVLQASNHLLAAVSKELHQMQMIREMLAPADTDTATSEGEPYNETE